MTASTHATRPSFRAGLQSLMVLGNLGGAVLTFLYFHYVDPIAGSGGVATTGAETAYFVIAFGLLSVIGRHLAKRWLAPLTRSGTVLPPGPADDTARRRALLLPTFVALASGAGWVAAAFNELKQARQTTQDPSTRTDTPTRATPTELRRCAGA